MTAKTRSAITAEISSNLPDNNSGLITPADIRQVTQDINDSAFNALSGDILPPVNGGSGVNAGSATNGEILIGNGSGFTLANLTASSNISIINTAGGIAIAATGGGTATTGSAPPVGLLFPAYIAPPSSYFTTMISAMESYPSVPVVIILNPDSGPGSSAQAAYTTIINSLIAAGATVIGYVCSDYGNRALATVESDVAKWVSYYPAIQGIFVDEMNYFPTGTSGYPNGHAYYVSLKTYINGFGLNLVIGNPGTNTIAEYFNNPTADVIVINETNGSWPTVALASNSGLGTQAQRASIVNGEAFNSADFSILTLYNKLVWATDNASADYAELPTYLATLFSTLSSINAAAPTTGYQVVAPTTGNTVTVANSTPILVLNPSGTLATLTIDMPTGALDGEEVHISSSHIITSITHSGNGSTLMNGLTSLAAGGAAGWIYQLSSTTWFRIQ